jgi:hypothetical protein
MATCKSCGEEIVYLTNAAKPDAKPNPIEIKLSDFGNIDADLDKGTYRIVLPGPGLRLSHFVNCPAREQYKRR